MYIKEKRSNNIFIKLYQRKFNVSDGYSEADATRPSYLLFYGANAVSTLPQINVCFLSHNLNPVMNSTGYQQLNRLCSHECSWCQEVDREQAVGDSCRKLDCTRWSESSLLRVDRPNDRGTSVAGTKPRHKTQQYMVARSFWLHIYTAVPLQTRRVLSCILLCAWEWSWVMSTN